MLLSQIEVFDTMVRGRSDDEEKRNAARRTIRVPKVRPTTAAKKSRNSVGKASVNNVHNPVKMRRNSSSLKISTNLAGNLNNPA